jgi:hypothetical protein
LALRAEQIVSNVRERSLRLILKLQFAGAVLAKELKSKKSQAVPKVLALQRAVDIVMRENMMVQSRLGEIMSQAAD